MRNTQLMKLASKALALVAFWVALALALPAASQAPPEGKESPIVSTYRVELNSASLDELMSIRGIGPALAKRIVEARRKRPFQSPGELIRVRGIGPQTLKRLLPCVRAAPPVGERDVATTGAP